MNAMNAALFGSTGAAVTSVFHQFPGGKSGSGAGRSPPREGACATAAAAREKTRSAVANLMALQSRFELRIAACATSR